MGIPGNEVVMRMWPMFYRYLRMTAVFFVVDAYSEVRENLKNIYRARQMLHLLLNEDELRCAAFVLVHNVYTPEGEEKKQEDLEFEQALEEMLGVPEIEQNGMQKVRFLKRSINCADITRESPVLKVAKTIGRDERKGG